MKELERIAANVAKALGLKRSDAGWWMDFEEVENEAGYERRLMSSGSNVFYPYWQVRCRGWLHRKGLFVTTWYGGGSVQDEDERLLFEASELSDKGSAEFCARAIDSLMTQETGQK
jgi:hypothetical protein